MPTNANATGVWTAQNKNNAKQGRQLLQALFENNDATPMNGTRSGVIPTTGLTLLSDLLVYNVVGLSMDVAPGWGIAHRAGQGPYAGELDSVVTVTCDAAPASNPRNDLVIMRMYDAALSDAPPGGQPCRIEIITGTPAASPLDPMTPNALGVLTGFTDGNGGVGIPLARAQVSTSGVITLTRIRRAASLTGAVRLVLESDTDSAGRVGQLRYNPTTDTLEVRRSDGTWGKMRHGADVGGEWRDARVTPAIATGATKLQFATNVVPANGLTFDGTSVWTVQTDGVYSVFCQLRETAAQNAGIAMGHQTTYADATHILPFLGFTGGPDIGLSGVVKLTAGQQFAFWCYNNGAGTTIANGTRSAMVKIWKQQAAA